MGTTQEPVEEQPEEQPAEHPHEQEEPGSWPVRAWTSLRDWATASPANFGSAAIVAVLAVSLPFGGWREAEEEPLSTPAPGTKVTAAPFEVTVERAVHGTDLGGFLTEPFTPGARHVVVELTLRNTSDQTLMATDLRQLVSVRGLPEPEIAGGEGDGAADEDTAAALEAMGFGGDDGSGDGGGADVDGADSEATDSEATDGDGAVGWTELYDMEVEPGLLVGLVPGLEYHVGLHQIVELPPGDLPEELTVRLNTLTYRQMSITDEFIWTDPSLTAEVVVPLEEAGTP